MQALNIGVIGCGYWGPNLIRNFIEIPDADVIAVADLDDGRLASIIARYPQIHIITQDYHQFFQIDLNAVVISTPPSTHFQIAMDCLEHGLHVLVEKPLTLNSEEAIKLIETARKKRRILMVGHTFEFNPAVQALKDIIANGELGVIHHIDAVRANLGLFQSDLNVLWDLAPHDISILIYILGQLPTRVSAQGMACIHPHLEDVAYMTLEFPGDIMANIRTSWLDPVKTRRITVVGSEKMLIYDDVSPSEKIKIFDIGVKTNERNNSNDPLRFAYKRGDVIIPHIQNSEPLRMECSHFLSCIRENKTPLTSGESGLNIVQIIETAQHSLLNGGVSVPVQSLIEPSEIKESSSKVRQMTQFKQINVEA
jgi:predicted dehydrogenase